MEVLNEGPFKAAWRDLEKQIVELCAYYDPDAIQQWLRTQVGLGGSRMREQSRWIENTRQLAAENEDPFTIEILTCWDGLKLRRNELEHAIPSESGLVYHNSQQVQGSYRWTAGRLNELIDDTLALTKKVKVFLAFAKLTKMDLELGGPLSLGSSEVHIGGHRPSECEYCGAQFKALMKDLVDKMISKGVVPSKEGWRRIAEIWDFDMSAEEIELEVRVRIQERTKQAEEVAEILTDWVRCSGAG